MSRREKPAKRTRLIDTLIGPVIEVATLSRGVAERRRFAVPSVYWFKREHSGFRSPPR
jgi:hypothetical protein